MLSKKRYILNALGLAWLVFLFAFYLGLDAPKPPANRDAAPEAKRELIDKEPDLTIDAYVMAKQFVAEGLRSPGTASFGGLFSGDYQDPDKCVTKTGENTYSVKGWVDSQNAFGATIRTNFQCNVRFDGGGRWVRESLEFYDR